MNRARIPQPTETAVLVKSARRCALCFHLSRDLGEKRGQIAHLDGNPSNAAEDNLAFLCFDHHSEFDSRTSQHKNYTPQEVKTARNRLYVAIAAVEHAPTRAAAPEAVRRDQDQATTAGPQLKLLAHPNLAVEVKVNRERRCVSVKISNRGAYPFRLDNAVMSARDDDGAPFFRPLHEISGGVIVGTSDHAMTWVFLHDARIEVTSGAFEDWVQIEFNCEDVIGLWKLHYSFCNITGLRELESA